MNINEVSCELRAGRGPYPIRPRWRWRAWPNVAACGLGEAYILKIPTSDSVTTMLSHIIRRMSKLICSRLGGKPKALLRVARKEWSRTWPYLWFVWVAVLSLRPSWKREFHTKGPLHVPGHALIFAVSAFVVCRSAQSVSQRVVRCAAVIGFGGALEALQSWIFRCRFEWEDVLTDACGVLLALLFVTCANRHSIAERYADQVIPATGLSRPARISASPQAALRPHLDGRRCRKGDTLRTSASALSASQTEPPSP